LGPFKIEVSKKAQRVSFENLLPEEQKLLANGVSFDPVRHDIFEFFLAPFFLSRKTGSKRWRRRNSYSRVDRVLVQTRFGSPDIALLGIFPTTRLLTGEHNLIFDGEALFEIAVPKFFKLKLSGQIKNEVKRKQYDVFASRTEQKAQWVFLKSYIASSSDFGLKVLCYVPKDLEDSKRHLLCDATFANKGRDITKIRNRKIHFPKLQSAAP